VRPVSGESRSYSVPYGNTREGRSSVSDDSKRSSVLDDKAPSDKIPPVSNDNVYANFERRKTCRGRGGVVFRDRPGTGPFSRREWYCRLRQNSNQTETALQSRPALVFWPHLVGHFRRFKLNPAVCRSSHETTVVPAKSRRPQMANAATSYKLVCLRTICGFFSGLIP
jgi:hypothetical protein